MKTPPWSPIPTQTNANDERRRRYNSLTTWFSLQGLYRVLLIIYFLHLLDVLLIVTTVLVVVQTIGIIIIVFLRRNINGSGNHRKRIVKLVRLAAPTAAPALVDEEVDESAMVKRNEMQTKT